MSSTEIRNYEPDDEGWAVVLGPLIPPSVADDPDTSDKHQEADE
jgi:hypothetical protein